jgi:hypothetical protein
LLKAAAFLIDELLDPRAVASEDPLDCAFSRAFGREPIFDYLEKPENAYRLRRAAVGMHGIGLLHDIDKVITGMYIYILPLTELAMFD